MTTDLAGATASALAELVRARQVSPVDVVQAHLERIRRLDPDLHAFQEVGAEQALAEARALEGRADLAELPLAGVPIAIKDHVDVAGLPTRNGSRATSTGPVAADAELVGRLRRAGAVILGKTAVPELCLWPFTESVAFGAARNPWSPSHSPGGSTGGGAAAVAAGLVPLALGSDGGGSIRIPSAWCGLFGIKPGARVIPMPEPRVNWFGLTEFGPLARSVADAALMLDVLAERTQFRDVTPPDRPLRIAVSVRSPIPWLGVAAPIRQAVEHAAELLRSQGHEVKWATPPYPPWISMAFLHRYFCGMAQEAAELPTERLEKRSREMARIGGWMLRKYPPHGASAVAWRRRALKWFERFDVALMPTAAQPPPPIGRFTRSGLLSTIMSVTDLIPFTPPWNLAGLPAASLPGGVGPDGIPIGIQLVGAVDGEATILGLAMQMERLQQRQA